MTDYQVPLTGPQLRVLREVLGAILNAPEWAEFTGDRDWATLQRGAERIAEAHRQWCRTESTPATPSASA